MRYILLILLLLIPQLTHAQMPFVGTPDEFDTLKEYFEYMKTEANSPYAGSEIEFHISEDEINYSIDRLGQGRSVIKFHAAEDMISMSQFNAAGDLIMETRMYSGIIQMYREAKSHFQKTFEGAMAQSELRTMSTATESYAAANDGKYPSSIDDLFNTEPPYLTNTYCDKSLVNYSFQCELSESGYKYTATPNENAHYSTVYTITTGGILKP